MSASDRIEVAPPVLQWARRTSGLDTQTAAKRLHVKEERLKAWEQGTVKPTIGQLRKLAKHYKRPLVVLLLSAPPKDFDALRDFRRTGETTQLAWSPALHAEFKRSLSQREVMLELTELAPGAVATDERQFGFAPDISPEEAGRRLRALLRMDEWKSVAWAEPRSVLRAAIESAEGLGVLVLQTRDIALTEMRGFSISEWPSPTIVLNGSDTLRGKLFTLLHELCHLALNTGGLCDLHEAYALRARDEDKLEHYCNEVAASALMPRETLLAEPHVQRATAKQQWSLEELAELSRRYGASSEAMLLRLISVERASWNTYKVLKPQLDQKYEEERQRRKEKQKAAGGGPSYYRIKARNLGHGYVASVLDAFYARAISSLDVADYLDIRFDQLTKLEEVVAR